MGRILLPLQLGSLQVLLLKQLTEDSIRQILAVLRLARPLPARRDAGTLGPTCLVLAAVPLTRQLTCTLQFSRWLEAFLRMIEWFFATKSEAGANAKAAPSNLEC
jgi:hypothetical protein